MEIRTECFNGENIPERSPGQPVKISLTKDEWERMPREQFDKYFFGNYEMFIKENTLVIRKEDKTYKKFIRKIIKKSVKDFMAA